MKILLAMRTSATRSLASWKGVLVVWLVSLMLVSLVVIPMKGVLKSGLGNSMITEKLAEGIDLDVFTDLGMTTKNLVASFGSGLIITVFVSFLVNAFLTGGLFESLRVSHAKFSFSEFYRASAGNFFRFLVILLIMGLIIMVLAILVVALPVALAAMVENPSEGIIMKTTLISSSIFCVLLAIVLLIADYARAWQVSNEDRGCFSAIGFGLKETFTKFFSSFPLMIMILLVQVLFGWIIFRLLPVITPVSGFGVFQFFILSQLMFMIRIFLKVWRYGSVTSLMEVNNPK